MTISLPDTFSKLVRARLARLANARPARSSSLKTFAVAAVSSLLALNVAIAQPAAGPLVLRLPSSTRVLSMGNAGGNFNDADALFYNPAFLYNARGVALSMQRYGSNGTAGSLANIVTLGSMNIGVGAQFVRWSAAPASYRELMRLGATQLGDSGGIDASSLAITFGFSKTFKGKRVAANAKYAEDRIGSANDGTLAFDFGVMGPSFGPGTFSLAVRNVGQGLRLNGEEGRLPTQLAIGWGGTYNNFTIWDMGYQTQLTIDRDGYVRPAAGLEVGYVPIEGVSFTARVGLRMPREDDESPATAGLGFNVDRFSLDYAFEPFLNGRSVSHRLGIRVK